MQRDCFVYNERGNGLRKFGLGCSCDFHLRGTPPANQPASRPLTFCLCPRCPNALSLTGCPTRHLIVAGAALFRMVTTLQSYISASLKRRPAATQGVQQATRLLALLHSADETRSEAARARRAVTKIARTKANAPLPPQLFVNAVLCSSDYHAPSDFMRWKKRKASAAGMEMMAFEALL